MQPVGGLLGHRGIVRSPIERSPMRHDAQVASRAMEFRRITNLPPYVFTIINNLKIEARRAGADVIDLGFGNPDIPSPRHRRREARRGRARTRATTATR